MTFSRPIKKMLAAFVCFPLWIVTSVSAEVAGPPEAASEEIPVFRFPRRVPSAGLAWSRERYSEQYLPANMATNQFLGRDDRDKERFLDVANRAYSREFVTGFSYTNAALARPVVTLSYCRKAETFAGRLIARGLKPHFVYQLKLSGDFQADPEGFERIGRLGRWRQLGSSQTNVSDAEYDAATDKSLFESYILFDFFVTDDKGDAEKEFYLDSTLHVLYNRKYQGWPSVEDSWPVEVSFTNTASWLYANPKPSVETQGVYAQTEAGQLGQVRTGIGEAFLPAGAYQARVTLVEETFHGYGDEGFWPTVMACPVVFEVVGNPRPTPMWTSLPKGVKVPFTDFVVRNAASQSVAEVECMLVLKGGVAYPTVEMTNSVRLGQSCRTIAAFDIATGGEQEIVLYGGPYRGLRDAVRHRIPKLGRKGWARIEVELTLIPQLETAWLTFLFSPKEPEIGLRNLSITSCGSLDRHDVNAPAH